MESPTTESEAAQGADPQTRPMLALRVVWFGALIAATARLVSTCAFG